MRIDKRDIGLPVAILAGGLATRLRPVTERVPKVLLEVGGRPFLEHQLEYLRKQGIRDVVVCIGYLGESICDRFGDGSRYGLRIQYSADGPGLLGTGGAVIRALPLLGDAFFVLYGDSYLSIDYADVADTFFRSGRRGLMTVFRNSNKWDTSNVEFSDGLIKKYDKKRLTSDMHYIDYGLSMYRASVFSNYPANTVLDLSEAIADLAASGELAGYEAKSRFYEIGSPAGLQELDNLLSTKNRREVTK
ncbi:MAG: nucleotidyltransferase family protein [Acidobacteriaceae bacterium]|nr:nucleotidyltransferase family protein [Acidobacteriaceae bacterium]